MLGFVYLIHSVLLLSWGVLSIREQPYYDVNNVDVVNNLFENFIVNYNRSYNATEKIIRLQYFKHNLALINKLNKVNADAVFDINDFADRSPEEKQAPLRLTLKKKVKGTSTCKLIRVKNEWKNTAPAAFDWEDHGAVTPVKNQEQCGSCWAHAVAATVEGQYAIKYKRQVVLSEQQLVDCTDNSTCTGGYMPDAYQTIIKSGGVMLQKDYKYTQKKDKCRFKKSKIAAKVTGCHEYDTNNEDAPLKDVLYNVGPLAISLYADGKFNHYTTGIISGENCAGNSPTHAVVLTGYGTENGTDFWNIKNSYGTSYGNRGFVKIQRGVKCLGIGEDTFSAVVG